MEMEGILIGKANIVWGWVIMVTGFISGMTLSAWAFNGPFKTPRNHENYTDLPRRLVRLAHVAMFMLPLINISYGEHIDFIPLSDFWKRFGSINMIICMVGVPSGLVVASFKNWFKYLVFIPVTCGFLALCVIAYGQF